MTEPLYLPAEERREIIRQYGKDYDIGVFVETGTADGETVAFLLKDFGSLYTIELDESLYRAAVNRFYDFRKVVCLHGDSGAILPSVIEDIRAFDLPALFWLDGHYCGGARGDIDTPIRAELDAAFKAPEGSVILIDDARLFDGGPEHTKEFADYPSLQWVKDRGMESGFDYVLKDDIIRLTPG